MSSKIVWSWVFILICFSCGMSENDQTDIPTLDMQAKILNNEEDNISQILFKIQMENYQGDLLKFGVSEISEHQERLNYYSSNFKKDILLVDGLDTIPCRDSHFERIYMDLPFRNFILTFPKNIIHSNAKLIIYDRQLSNQLVQVQIPQ